ncbi:MAG: Gldg family protein [Christensenellales bacterium]|jgi:ABC-2 type transport system permease protein
MSNNINENKDMKEVKEIKEEKEMDESKDRVQGGQEEKEGKGEGSRKKAGKSISGFFRRFRESKNVKYGTYSTVLILIVLVAVVAVNIGVTALTNSLDLNLDLTRNRKYTLSQTSKNVINRLDKDIYIYAMFPEATKDSYPDYVKLFDNIQKQNSLVKVEYVDPTANPTFTNQFLGGAISAISGGSVIVSREDASKFRVLTQSDFYQYQYDSTYSQIIDAAFKGEDALTNALLYVNSETSPKVYWYSGHGETPISYYSDIQTYLQRENFECLTIESMGLGALVSGDTLVITAPQRDISSEELEQLKGFMNQGGRLIYLSTPGLELPNFEELLSVFGIGMSRDVVVEGSANYYFYSPSVVVPQLGSHKVTSTLRSNNLAAYMQGSHSLVNLDIRNSLLTVENILTTSDTSYGKTNLQSTVIEKEEGDTDGPFVIAMSAEMINDHADPTKNARMVVFGSNAFLTSYYTLGGNADLFLQTVKYMQNEDTEVVNIIGKSMMEDVLSFTSYTQIYVAAGVGAIGIPLVVLLIGIVVWLRRRHL